MKGRNPLRAGREGVLINGVDESVGSKLHFQSSQAQEKFAEGDQKSTDLRVPQPLYITYQYNSSASPLVGQAAARRAKHIPINISAYQQNGGFSPFSPITPSSSSASFPIQLGPGDHSSGESFLNNGVNFATWVKTKFCLPAYIDHDRCKGFPERDPIHQHVPGVTAVYAHRPASNATVQLPDCREPELPTPLHPLRHKKRLTPPPLVIQKDKLLTYQTIEIKHLPKADESVVMMERDQSQISLSMLDLNRDDVSAAPKTSVSATAQVGIPSSASPHVGGSGPTNLSGLVCNVHRTTGQEPHPLVGGTTTILGDKLYVFGGRVLSRRQPQLSADLYELDLIKRHWTRLDTTGEVPSPRYFHSVCPLGDTKLVCYGGMTPSPLAGQVAGNTAPTQQHADMQPEVMVASDIHIYDVTTQAWTLVRTAGDGPQGRYAHCAAILPSSAVFTSANAPLSAIHHNPSSSNPHSGTLGRELDGTGGAEMVVVGGQDSSNHYIEQISVFNLRSLKWMATNSLGRSCGAYRSVVAPLTGMSVNDIGRGPVLESDPQTNVDPSETGSSMLMYSNYNFLDVKLELQVRLPDGRLVERTMSNSVSPPGLRFPNGGVINNHFVVSGTYLTSSKQEYALWALDLRNLTWGRIDAGGTVFGQGSWNRGVLWNRRNTFVILGHRKRSLVDDYNHRRINFSHLCMVELEAFGLYENPRKASPTSDYLSISSPPLPKLMQLDAEDRNGGGRPLSTAAEHLGQALTGIQEFADMDLVGLDGERIPVNSSLLSRRWGPYFNQLLLQSAASHDNWSLSDAVTLRTQMTSQASRNSSITITPSIGKSSIHTATTLTSSSGDKLGLAGSSTQSATRQALNSLEATDAGLAPPGSRARTLYLPHTSQTLRLLVNYLYTSSLPPVTSHLCTPQILCSLLQVARPYRINGLLEATVERLHEVLDGRNAAAVFNASAMAAGGGRGLNPEADGTLAYLQRRDSEANTLDEHTRPGAIGRSTSAKNLGLKINTSMPDGTTSRQQRGHEKANSLDSASTAKSASTATSFSHTDTDSEATGTHEGSSEQDAAKHREGDGRQVWTGDVSSVIGLQKRGLRGLMEGRRLRERGNTVDSGAAPTGRPPGA